MKRIDKGLTLEEVGAACGVGKSTVRKWENGFIKNIGNSRLSKLAEILDLPPAALIDTKYFVPHPYSNDEAHVISSFRDLRDQEKQTAILNILDAANTPSGSDYLSHLAELDFCFSEEEMNVLRLFRTLNKEGQISVLSYLSYVAANPAMVSPPSIEESEKAT